MPGLTVSLFKTTDLLVARHALADQHQCLIDVRHNMRTLQQQIKQLAARQPAYPDLERR